MLIIVNNNDTEGRNKKERRNEGCDEYNESIFQIHFLISTYCIWSIYFYYWLPIQAAIEPTDGTCGCVCFLAQSIGQTFKFILLVFYFILNSFVQYAFLYWPCIILVRSAAKVDMKLKYCPCINQINESATKFHKEI